MNHFGQKAVLLAPTGRAAKVSPDTRSRLSPSIRRFTDSRSSGRERPSSRCQITCIHTLFIVDEASMINNESLDYSIFEREGCDDLIQYVYSVRVPLMLIGDNAQLPPVKQRAFRA